jgi:hypothetical protein
MTRVISIMNSKIFSIVSNAFRMTSSTSHDPVDDPKLTIRRDEDSNVNCFDYVTKIYLSSKLRFRIAIVSVGRSRKPFLDSEISATIAIASTLIVSVIPTMTIIGGTAIQIVATSEVPTTGTSLHELLNAASEIPLPAPLIGILPPAPLHARFGMTEVIVPMMPNAPHHLHRQVSPSLPLPRHLSRLHRRKR